MKRLLIGAAVLAIWFVVAAPTGLGGPLGMVWVSGASMEPTLSSGDLVITYGRGGYDDGDIVAFEIPSGGTVIHRIIESTDAGYRFQGDNRAFPDPWILGSDELSGREVLTISNAAGVARILGDPRTMSLLVAGLVALWWWGRSVESPTS